MRKLIINYYYNQKQGWEWGTIHIAAAISLGVAVFVIFFVTIFDHLFFYLPMMREVDKLLTSTKR